MTDTNFKSQNNGYCTVVKFGSMTTYRKEHSTSNRNNKSRTFSWIQKTLNVRNWKPRPPTRMHVVTTPKTT